MKSSPPSGKFLPQDLAAAGVFVLEKLYHGLKLVVLHQARPFQRGHLQRQNLHAQQVQTVFDEVRSFLFGGSLEDIIYGGVAHAQIFPIATKRKSLGFKPTR